jgi:hypothetical protein
MGALDYLSERTDERVQAALKRVCGICHAKVGQDCRHPFETREPMERIVHPSRSQQDLDKRSKGATA